MQSRRQNGGTWPAQRPCHMWTSATWQAMHWCGCYCSSRSGSAANDVQPAENCNAKLKTRHTLQTSHIVCAAYLLAQRGDRHAAQRAGQLLRLHHALVLLQLAHDLAAALAVQLRAQKQQASVSGTEWQAHGRRVEGACNKAQHGFCMQRLVCNCVTARRHGQRAARHQADTTNN